MSIVDKHQFGVFFSLLVTPAGGVEFDIFALLLYVVDFGLMIAVGRLTAAVSDSQSLSSQLCVR